MDCILGFGSFSLKSTQPNADKPPMERNLGELTSEGVNDNFEVNCKSESIFGLHPRIWDFHP